MAFFKFKLHFEMSQLNILIKKLLFKRIKIYKYLKHKIRMSKKKYKEQKQKKNYLASSLNPIFRLVFNFSTFLNLYERQGLGCLLVLC